MTTAAPVRIGYVTATTLDQRWRRPGKMTAAHQVAQHKCRLGMAANGSEMCSTTPELNDHNAPKVCKVSVNPYDGGSRRGGSTGNKVKPTRAAAVATARPGRDR